MEFYVRTEYKDVLVPSFNSQRDGILPNLSIDDKSKNKVSIPNGMEFYRVFIDAYPSPVSSFQFPTGWNSTRFIGANGRARSVSIPNGMEFYRGF